MKLQSLAVLFIIIILPISMVLSYYTKNQVKTLELQNTYDTRLDNATQDALTAFQLNTFNESYSDIIDTKIESIEASVNAFFNSISRQFNMAGYNQEILKEFTPALVYTMYDGYYIYSPFFNTLDENDKVGTEDEIDSKYASGKKISNIKPYIYYSCRYKKDKLDVVITYALDTHITVQGTDKNGNPLNISGYVMTTGTNGVNVTYDGSSKVSEVKYRNVAINKESLLKEYIGANNDANNLYSYLKVNGVKYYKDPTGTDKWFSISNDVKIESNQQFEQTNYSAVNYYVDSFEFMNKLQTAGILDINANMAQDIQGTSADINSNYKIFENPNGGNLEDANSNFNRHRLAVIRYSIEKNLSIAIANYNKYGNLKATFEMPLLREDEWELLINNISIISFLQGLSIGGKIYNGYSIATNSKNKEVVAENSIYITINGDDYYHAINEKDLEAKASNAIGYLNVDFERVMLTDKDSGTAKYFYPKKQLASYDSVVTQNKVNSFENIYQYLSDKPNLAKAYYTAIARERFSMYKVTENAEDKHQKFSPNYISSKYNLH